MIFEVKGDNANYAAKIVELPSPRKHNNADKLQCVNIDNNNVITGLDAKEGDLYVFFPVECAINLEYLKWSNSFAAADRNKDTNKKGFFGNAGRVRAIKLRGEKSEGYIIPASELEKWLREENGIMGISTQDFFVPGTEFTHVGEVEVCKKYINLDALRALNNVANAKKKKVKRASKIVDNQFRLHIDTAPLKKNIGLLNPDDTITISYKLHGTSGVFSKILCKKPLSPVLKFLRWTGLPIVDTHYDYVYSSRKVIKNAYADKVSASYYDMDVWALVNKELEGKILDGVTLYGEIVGQLPNGKWIQKDFDYGTEPGKHDFYVYRITFTNPSGDTFEFTTSQIERYCKKFTLKTVPVFYQGKAKDWDKSISTDQHWHENLLTALMAKYNEKDCYICKTKVPEEGVVITRENEYFEPFKLKSFKFLQKESEELDKGEVDIETQESINEETNIQP